MTLEPTYATFGLIRPSSVGPWLEYTEIEESLSLEEREKEITVHRDVLLAENKAAENERHKVNFHS